MATKRRSEPEQPASSRTTITVLAIGALIVAALVVWALTRTVESPAPVADTSQPIATPSASSATQTPTPMTAEPPAEATASVPRIAVEDLREKMKTNAVTVIDVRDEAAFAAAHIPGSLHIPFARVEGEMSTLPKGKPIVTYCT
jgi:hypothetical protein